MLTLISCLFILPVAISIVLLILPKSISKLFVVVAGLLLSAISIYLFAAIGEPLHISAPPFANKLVVGLDLLLLLFFGYVAVSTRNVLVGIMTLLQLCVSLYLLQNVSTVNTAQLMIDKLSLFMFVLINVISSIIAIFSLKYIDEEDCSAFRKKYFLSILFWFIGVMNLVVSSDHLEYFFLFFELTTLASYLLISFRKDETSIKNALTALWMNQIGGLAILAAIFFIHFNGYGEASFSNLLTHASASTVLLPIGLLSIAALIKGAQMPFSKWLLGAMVAPTPVSALLHSSTMVKIAPFIILRLSPALQGTPVAWVIIALTGFVFAASAVGALSQDNFKRILAHSTIALLALMIMMSAVATPVTILAALILILFHGISKCILFLNAGVLEKVFHRKQLSDMDRLAESGLFTSLVVAIGFMSLLLPPFGAFIGKWFSIETLGSFAMHQKALGAVVIVLIAFGGAVLSLLYFKVLGLIISRNGDHEKVHFEKTNFIYRSTIVILLGLLVAAVLGFPFVLKQHFIPVASQALMSPIAVSTQGWSIHIDTLTLPIVPLLFAFLLLPATIVAAMFVRFRNVDRVNEYACGEKVNYSFSALYFSTDKATPYFTAVGILFFAILLAVVLT